jgi:FG-GAP repeat
MTRPRFLALLLPPLALTGACNFKGTVGTLGDDIGSADADGGAASETGLSALGVGDLLLTELMVDPTQCLDENAEYIEVLNTTSEAVDLEGLVVTDGSGLSSTLATSVWVEAGGRVVGLRGSGTSLDSSCYGFNADFRYDASIELSNRGGSISIGSATEVFDTVDFEGWDLPSAASLNLRDDATTALDNDSEANWCEASTAISRLDAGTPGAANDSCPDPYAEGSITGELTVADADVTFWGGTKDLVGYWGSIAPAGDVNGDGKQDLLLGARGNTVKDANGRGAVYVVHGPLEGTYDLTTDADATVYGGEGTQYFGSSVEGGHDVDGDGNLDLVVGAEGTDGEANGSGAVFVYYGPLSGDLSTAEADVVVHGLEEYDMVGAAMQVVDDVTGDGLPDLMTGAYRRGWAQQGINYAGVVDITSVATAGEFTLADAAVSISAERGEGGIGHRVDQAGDLDGDGLADLIVGALNSDDAYVWYAPFDPAMEAADADYKIRSTVGPCIGSALSSAGDTDGDGYADAVVGNAYASVDGIAGVGMAYLLRGDASRPTGSVNDTDLAASFYGDVLANSGAGGWVEGIGDIDGDGNDDIAIGALLGGPAAAGTTYVSYGPQTGAVDLSRADARINGVIPQGLAAYTRGLGDLNDDGRDDFTIGAWIVTDRRSYQGAAYLFYGMER